jgi:putative mRNA 3-end processing factor
MLQGGAIYAYIPDLYKDKKSSMFLTGYQVKDTPGAILQKTGKIAIEGKMVDLKMELKKFDFSAHASRSELFTTVRKLNPKKVVCVHGDPEVAAVFVKDLKKEGFDAVAPRVGEEVIV